MNATARRLGTTDTVAGDPAGLDAPGQVTSPFDLALLGRAALADRRVSRYLTVPKAVVPVPLHTPFQIQNHNRLLGTYPGCIGVKNGYTNAAQATYVGAARRGGHTLLVTLLHSPPAYAKDARALLDWGFRNLGRIVPVGNLDTRPAAAEVLGPGARAARGAPGGSAVGPHRVGAPSSGGGGTAGDVATIAVVAGGAAAAGTVVGGSAYLVARRRRRRAYPSSPYLR
jgi:D-alanyl-D-alanine carboxypeptidase (penicillin-binding protein 5/6)